MTPKMEAVSAGSGAGDAVSRRSSVLVATSDSATRNLLRQILHVGAVDLVDAVDGVEALALARRLDLDLIVLDAFLAVMDGISVCGRIRTLTDIDQPPIIMVGLISERAVELAHTAGADETLAKPLSPSLIRSRTRALLTRRREEKRLRLVERALEAAPVGLTVLDARSSEYSVTQANPAFLEMTGYPPEEILGHNLRLLTGAETDVTAMMELRDSMAAGRPSRVLLKNHRRGGEPFWNDLSTAPVFDEAGRLTHYVAVQHDVTKLVEDPARQAARATEDAVLERTAELESALSRVEARRRFAETILNSMVSAILTTDARGTVTFANLSALRTLGTSFADCVGRSVAEIFGHNEGVAEIVEGGIPAYPEHRLDFPLTTPGGARIYVGVSIMHAPAEFREEISLIFLFRNLAETILEEGDPRLMDLDQPAVRLDEARQEGPPGVAGSESEESPGEVESVASVGEGAVVDDAASVDSQAARQRVLLSLRYTQLTDLVTAVVNELAAEHGKGGSFVRVEKMDDVPEVLLDRQQVSQAVRLLLARSVDRCEDPSEVRVRISRTEAVGGRAGRPSAGACVEILYRRALITNRDLSEEGEAATRPAYRRGDLDEAEKLIEANGGQLHRPRRDAEEQVLTVLFRGAR